MQVALLVVIIWINPSGVVEVSTRIWLKAWISASLWVLEVANKLQMDIRAWVLYSYLKISPSSLLTSLLESVPPNGLVVGRVAQTILPLWVITCTSTSTSSGHRINRVNVTPCPTFDGVKGINYNGALSGIKLNSEGTGKSDVTPTIS